LKTSLDHLPRRKQTELKRVVDVLFTEFDDMLKLATSQQKKRGRILKIILYGSYARGDWVEDRASGYMSDYDLLVIVNQRQLVDKAACWEKADDWFVSRRSPETQVHFFVETLHEVNDKLAQGYYFFTDIKKEGIALYELKGHTLAEPKNLSEKDAKKLSDRHLSLWLERAQDDFRTFRFAFAEGMFNKSAFELHQTIERLYSGFLLSRTLYVPNTHNIKFLRSLAEDIDPALRTVWPRDTRRARALFELLKRSYVEARYSEHFKVTEEELVWLGECAEKLQKLVTTRAPRTGGEAS
jgi:predicted nucleotidyltransferase/HEPN domain-containing protein